MSFLSTTFNHSLVKSDPAVPTYERTVSFLDDGSEVVSFEPVDFKSIKQANGKADFWNLSTLVKHGINPSNISGHSSSGARIENVSVVGDMQASVEKFFDGLESESESVTESES